MLGAAGLDLDKLGFAWARVVPIVIVVPAFGLRALPWAGRAVIALALAAAIAPAISIGDAAHVAGLVEEVTRGLAVAVSAAVPLWAATMAGGVMDALRAAPDRVRSPVVDGTTTPLGVPMSLLASAIFLAGGGASRVIAEVARSETATHPVLRASHDLVGGVALAVALGGPVLAASAVLEIGAGLVARAAAPAQIHVLLAPLRALAILVVIAVSLDRIAEALALAMR